MQAPCKDCPDRVLGCHSICKEYIAFDKYRKEISAKRAEFRRVENDYFEAHRKRKKKKRW